MGKSESRFDLNRDFNTTWDSIWLLKIRFRPTGFGIRFANFRDSIWSCKIWEPNPWITNVYAAHVLVGPFPCHKHNNDMASAWEHFVCNQRVEVPTWVKTRRTWRSHLQVTHQRHFGGRTTIQLCDSWRRSTWAASNSVAGAIVRACHNRLLASTVESVLLSMQQWFYKSM